MSIIPSPTPKADYLHCIKHTQLISVDLIIEINGSVLMGFRSNAPAFNTYFVPGGRVFKGESIEAAIERVSGNEIGVGLKKEMARDKRSGTRISTHQRR